MRELIETLELLVRRGKELESFIDCATENERSDIQALEEQIESKVGKERSELRQIEALVKSHREELQLAYDQLLAERFAHLKEGEIPPEGWALPHWIGTRTTRTFEVTDWSAVPEEYREWKLRKLKDAVPGTKAVARTSLVLYAEKL